MIFTNPSNELSVASTKPKLFVLLVGIDDYRAPIAPLEGCVSDIEKVQAYLERENSFEVLTLKLINEQATKENIVAGFLNHLIKAKEGDTALFYYSGHGTQEEAEEVFWKTESDKKLECLVCYDSVPTDGNLNDFNLLADKELRYLINRVGNNSPHILSIFDCCHSGSNTRNGNFIGHGQSCLERRVIKRDRLSKAFPKRNWNKFIFGSEIDKEKVKSEGILELIPEGKHIQMAACQNDESAYEVHGEGVFTKNLIELLERSKGNISYHRLQSIIVNNLRHQFSQTPKIYTTETADFLLSGFLNKEVEESALKATASYNQTQGWVLDMGSMHGIASGHEIDLEHAPSKRSIKAKVKRVYGTHSTISFENDLEDLQQHWILTTEVSDILTSALQIYLDPSFNAIQGSEILQDKIEKINCLHSVTASSQADFVIKNLSDHIVLSRSAKDNIPIVPKIPVKDFGEGHMNILLNYLLHLARYTYVRNLYNPGSFLLTNNVIAIKIRNGTDPHEQIPIHNEELLLNYEKTSDGWKGSIQIQLKNITDKKLYCALCYLSFNFGVHVKVLGAGVEGIESNSVIWALDGAPINFKLEPEVLNYRYSESRTYLKLIISTEDFTNQLNTLALENLPGPLAPTKGDVQRGLGVEDEVGVVHDWTTRLITVRMPNPEL